MPMVHACARQDCGQLTMGGFCVDHEERREDFQPEPRHATTPVARAVIDAAPGSVDFG
jgi:hypothetical protein